MHILTKGSTRLLECRLEDFLISKGYSMEWLNHMVNETVAMNGERTREALVAVDSIFTQLFETMFGRKLPYTFGGGHFFSQSCRFLEANGDFNESEETSVNPNWGYAFSEEEIEKYKHSDGTLYTNYGPDASAYIMILLKFIGVQNNLCKNGNNMINGAVYTNEAYAPLGKVYVLNEENFGVLTNKEKFESFYSIYNEEEYMVKPGDILHRARNYTMLVTKVDREKQLVYTSESKGGFYGVIRTAYTWDELYELGDVSIISIDDLLENPEKVMGCYKEK